MRGLGKLIVVLAAFLFSPSIACLAEGEAEAKLTADRQARRSFSTT